MFDDPHSTDVGPDIEVVFAVGGARRGYGSEMAPSLLVRPRHDKWIAGVCGGIEEATGFNGTALRVIFAILGLTVAPVALILYLGLWLVIPEA